MTNQFVEKHLFPGRKIGLPVAFYVFQLNKVTNSQKTWDQLEKKIIQNVHSASIGNVHPALTVRSLSREKWLIGEIKDHELFLNFLLSQEF